MKNSAFLIYDAPNGATTSFVVGNDVIPAPAFIPEVKNEEDIRALLRFPAALPERNPIIVPANRWMQLISNPIMGLKAPLSELKPINNFLESHPIFAYDPPEMFRYSLGGELVKYALKGDKIKRRQFNGYLNKGETNQALDMVDPFFQPFIKRQISKIRKQIQKKCPNLGVMDKNKDEPSPHVERAWLDDKIDEAYPLYLYEIASQMLKMPSSILIPPVPPLTKTSESTYISRVKSSNLAASIVCERLSERNDPIRGMRSGGIYPYFHIYIDWGVSREKQNTSAILKMVEDGLDRGVFAGIAITINGYVSAAAMSGLHEVEYLINEIVNISQQSEVPKPVILPRSGWFGLSLTDIEIQGFSILMNGSYQYSSGGGAGNPEDKYGKIPLIDSCLELKFNEIRDYIKQYGEFPSVPNLPRKPTKEDLDNPKLYRERVAKPMRLIHVEEARRIRKEKSKGIQSPAKRYLERSSHIYLGETK